MICREEVDKFNSFPVSAYVTDFSNLKIHQNLDFAEHRIEFLCRALYTPFEDDIFHGIRHNKQYRPKLVPIVQYTGLKGLGLLHLFSLS